MGNRLVRRRRTAIGACVPRTVASVRGPCAGLRQGSTCPVRGRVLQLSGPGVGADCRGPAHGASGSEREMARRHDDTWLESGHRGVAGGGRAGRGVQHLCGAADWSRVCVRDRSRGRRPCRSRGRGGRRRGSGGSGRRGRGGRSRCRGRGPPCRDRPRGDENQAGRWLHGVGILTGTSLVPGTGMPMRRANAPVVARFAGAPIVPGGRLVRELRDAASVPGRARARPTQ